MERLRFIVEQIEESKKLIQSGDIFNFRMAFVLLDNASEILMYRRVSSDLIDNGFLRQMRESATSGLTQEKLIKFDAEVQLPKIIDVKRERLIKRYFDEKTKFLSEDKPYLSKSTASVLRSLHKYRNELYHNDIVREETIRASVILLYEIVCDLLRFLPPSYYSMPSPDNYETPAWKRFLTEHKLKGQYISGDKVLQKTSRQLKKDIVININDLRSTFKIHILTRIDEAIHNIEFVMRDGLNTQDPERALKQIQYVGSGKVIGHKDIDKLLKQYKAKYSMNDFEKWKKRIGRFDSVKSKIELFKVYSIIENEFEQLESQINHAAMELDAAIQSAIDIARGK